MLYFLLGAIRTIQHRLLTHDSRRIVHRRPTPTNCGALINDDHVPRRTSSPALLAPSDTPWLFPSTPRGPVNADARPARPPNKALPPSCTDAARRQPCSPGHAAPPSVRPMVKLHQHAPLRIDASFILYLDVIVASRAFYPSGRTPQGPPSYEPQHEAGLSKEDGHVRGAASYT